MMQLRHSFDNLEVTFEKSPIHGEVSYNTRQIGHPFLVATKKTKKNRKE